MTRPKIIYGISGIGNGHTYRQLPIIEGLVDSCQITIFAYDDSYRFYSRYFRKNKSVQIEQIVVPFFVGQRSGLDFSATERSLLNAGKDFFATNMRVFARTAKRVGRPSIVVTDYEPVCAQYAYAVHAPLVTIDQQSKFLCGAFPASLGGFTYQDEVARLRMFFPRAETRIACSFFRFPVKTRSEIVRVLPPTIRDPITRMKPRRERDPRSILMYISSAREFAQSPVALRKLLSKLGGMKYDVFVKKSDAHFLQKIANPHVRIHRHGSPEFLRVLQRCSGIVSTAGHSLLSEAMYLQIPVYAIPVSPYEQHLNARVIDQNGFGISCPTLTRNALSFFEKNINRFQKSIERDRLVLMRGVGQKKVIDFLQRRYLT